MEDKVVRQGNQASFEQALLMRAQRAISGKRYEDLPTITDAFQAMSAAARKTGDKRLKSQCEQLGTQLCRILKGSAAPLLETKGAVARLHNDSPSEEEHAVALGAAIGEIRGLGAAYSLDHGGDIIVPGAFRKTLAKAKAEGRMPRMLAQHDSGVFPIGAWTEMRETADGLEVVGLVADTPRGREAWALIHMVPSALDGLSIGFSLLDADYDRDGNRLIKEIELWEVSLVGMPMNTDARLYKPKQADRISRGLSDLRAALDNDGGRVLQFPSINIRDDDEEAQAVAALHRLAQNLRG